MNLKRKLGLTGGIGSGKSVVGQILEVMGFPVYYADDRAKWLMNHLPGLKQSIVRLMGPESYRSGELDRGYVASRVFRNPQMLDKLNQLVHPEVQRDFDQWVEEQSSDLVGKEAALLFETGSYRMLDATWLITCPVDVRIRRILERDPFRSDEDIRAIMAKQWSDEKKRKLADFEIINDGQQAVLAQVLQGLSDLKVPI